jgi:hypothetical protein
MNASNAVAAALVEKEKELEQVSQKMKDYDLKLQEREE